MSQTNFYDLCCRYHGRNVRITCRDGRVHRGEITRVTRDMVWIRPTEGLGGYGLGFGGFGFGGFRFGFGIALGAITGIALASAFFW
ncbi:hypothetical protein JSQ81_08635 [Sporosarcina sp. Marseille-Q4063]|uniref:hypothetical protein n=1 Tax=Sporosarcina sp. Marseille-Q4063 TaxID=2810514 RepID=UPI001BAF8D3E|nr:hypothetical protein [Sporosarcina sp. Marseille-Q4063]QUW23551.1 hypothetical protein JSQ81_08635 [Sporosarcina sp. Marseille-Q4063]